MLLWKDFATEINGGMSSSHRSPSCDLLPPVTTLTPLLLVPFPPLPASASSPMQPCALKARSLGEQMFFFSLLYQRQSSVACGGLHVGRAASSCEAEPVWARFSCLWLKATQKLGRGTCPEEPSVHQLSARGEILTWGYAWDGKHSPLRLEGGTS